MTSAPLTQSAVYDPSRTALLFVDPYNDFLAEGGKLWPRVAEVARAVGLHDNLRAVTAAARAAGIPVFIVPHHRAEPNDFQAGIIPHRINLGPPRHRFSPRIAGAASGILISRRSRATPSSRSTGAEAGSPIPIWTCC
jgi:nicotinamidase-related amidase